MYSMFSGFLKILYTQKNVSNIYVHFLVCLSQYSSDLNHQHHHKDIAIIVIIYIQVFIICDKNGIDNPNGRQSEKSFHFDFKTQLGLYSQCTSLILWDSEH